MMLDTTAIVALAGFASLLLVSVGIGVWVYFQKK